MMTNPKRTLTSRRMQLIFSLVLIAAAAVGLARMVTTVAVAQSDHIEGGCDPVVISEFFDRVTPPALPAGWSSTTWTTSEFWTAEPAS